MGTEVEVQLQEALLAIKDKATRVRFGDNALFLEEAGELQKDLESQLFELEKQICEGVQGETEARLLKESESIKGEIHQNKKCASYLQRIACLEEDFTKLMHTVMARAKAMRDNPHGDKVTSQVVADCWSQVQRMSDLTRVHTKNAADYYQFFFDYRDTFMRLKDRWHQLEHWLTAFSPKPIVRETDSIKTFMQNQLTEFLCLWQRVQTVVASSRRVVPVQQRLEPTRQPRPALLLCPFENSEVRLDEGAEVTLLDNADSLRWRVSAQNDDGQTVAFDVPSIMLWLPPPDISVTELALKLEEKFLSLWGSSAARFQTVLCEYLTLLFRHLSAHDYAEFESPEQWQLLKQEVHNLFGDDDRFESVMQTLAHLDRRNDPAKRGSRKRVLLKEAEIVQLRSMLAKLESHIKYWESFRRQSLAVRGSEYWLTELDCSNPVLHNSIALLETLQSSGQEQLESLIAKLNTWRISEAAEQRRHVRKLRRQEVLVASRTAGGDAVADLLQFQLPSQRTRQADFNEAAAVSLHQIVDEAHWSELSSAASSSVRGSVAGDGNGHQWLRSRGLQTARTGTREAALQTTERGHAEHATQAQIPASHHNHGIQAGYATVESSVAAQRPVAADHASQTTADGGLSSSAVSQRLVTEQSGSQFDSQRVEHGVQTRYTTSDTLMLSSRAEASHSGTQFSQTEGREYAIQTKPDTGESSVFFQSVAVDRSQSVTDHSIQTSRVLKDTALEFSGPKIVEIDLDEDWQTERKVRAVSQPVDNTDSVDPLKRLTIEQLRDELYQRLVLIDKCCQAGFKAPVRDIDTQFVIFQSDKDLTAKLASSVTDSSVQASSRTTEGHTQYVLFKSDKDLSTMLTPTMRDTGLQASRSMTEGQTQYLLFQSDKDLTALISPGVRDASQQASRTTTESQVQYVLFQSDKDLSALVTSETRDASLQASSQTREGQAQYILFRSDKDLNTVISPVKDASLKAGSATTESQVQYVLFQSDQDLSTILSPAVRDASLQASATTREGQAQYLSQQADKYMSAHFTPTVRDASQQVSTATRDGQAQYILFQSDKDLNALMAPQLKDASLQASSQTADGQAQYILFQSDKDLATVSTVKMQDATMQSASKSSDSQTQFVLFQCDSNVRPVVKYSDFSAQARSLTADTQAQYIVVQSDKDVSALAVGINAAVSKNASGASTDQASQYLLFQASKQLSAFVESVTTETQAAADANDKETQFILFSAENLKTEKPQTRDSETQFILFESNPTLTSKLIGRDAQSQTVKLKHEYLVFHTPQGASAATATSPLRQADSAAQYQAPGVDREDQTAAEDLSDAETQCVPRLMRDSQGGYCLALNQADALIRGKQVSEAEAQSYLTRMADGVVVARVAKMETSDFQQQVHGSRSQVGGLRDAGCQFELFSSDKQVANCILSNASQATATEEDVFSKFAIFESQPKLEITRPRLLKDASGQYYLSSTAQGTSPIPGRLIADSQVQTVLQSSDQNIVARVTEEAIVPLTSYAARAAFVDQPKPQVSEIFTQYDLLTRDQSLAVSFGSSSAEASTQPQVTSDSMAQYLVFTTDTSSSTSQPDLRQMAINTEVALVKDSSGQFFLGSSDGSVLIRGTQVSPAEVVHHLTSSENSIVVMVSKESAEVNTESGSDLVDVATQYLMYSSDKDASVDTIKSSMSLAQKACVESKPVFQPTLLRDSSGQYYLNTANSNVAVQGVFVTESQARQCLATSEKNIVARIVTETRDFMGQTVRIVSREAVTKDSSNQSDKVLTEVDTQYMLYTSSKSLETDLPKQSVAKEFAMQTEQRSADATVFQSKLMKDSSGQYYLYSCDSNVAIAGKMVSQSEARHYLASSEKNIVVRVSDTMSDFSTQTHEVKQSAFLEQKAQSSREQRESQTQYVLFSSDKSLSANLTSEVAVQSADTVDNLVPRLMKDSSGQYFLCSADSGMAVAGTPIAESQVKNFLASSDKNIVAKVITDSKDFSSQTAQPAERSEGGTQSGEILTEMQTQYALYSSNKSLMVDFSAATEDFSTQTASRMSASSAVVAPVVMRDNSGQFYLTSEDSSVRVFGKVVTEAEAMRQLNTSDNSIVARVVSRVSDFTSQTALDESRRQMVSSEQQYELYSSSKSIATADIKSSEEFGAQVAMTYTDSAVSQAKLMKDNSGQFYLVSSTADVTVRGESVTEAEAQYYLESSEKNIVARVISEGRDFSTQTMSQSRATQKESSTQSSRSELTDVQAQYALYSSSKGQTVELIKSSEDFSTQTRIASVHSGVAKPSLLRDSAGQYYLASQDSKVKVQGRVVTESEARMHLSTSEKSIVARIITDVRDFTTQTVSEDVEQVIIAERQQYELYSANRDLSALASNSEDFAVQVRHDSADMASQFQPKLMRDSYGQYYLSSADSNLIISGQPVSETQARSYLASSDKSIVARVSSETRESTMQTVPKTKPELKQTGTQSGSTLVEVDTQYSLYSSSKSLTANVIKTSEEFGTQTKTSLKESTFVQPKLMCDSAGQYYLSSEESGMMVRGQIVTESEARHHLSSSDKSIVAKVVSETLDFASQTAIESSSTKMRSARGPLRDVQSEFVLYASDKNLSTDVATGESMAVFLQTVETRDEGTRVQTQGKSASALAGSRVMVDASGQYFLKTSNSATLVPGVVASSSEARAALESSDSRIVARVFGDGLDVSSQTTTAVASAQSVSTTRMKDVSTHYVLMTSSHNVFSQTEENTATNSMCHSQEEEVETIVQVSQAPLQMEMTEQVHRDTQVAAMMHDTHAQYFIASSEACTSQTERFEASGHVQAQVGMESRTEKVKVDTADFQCQTHPAAVMKDSACSFTVNKSVSFGTQTVVIESDTASLLESGFQTERSLDDIARSTQTEIHVAKRPESQESQVKVLRAVQADLSSQFESENYEFGFHYHAQGADFSSQAAPQLLSKRVQLGVPWNFFTDSAIQTEESSSDEDSLTDHTVSRFEQDCQTMFIWSSSETQTEQLLIEDTTEEEDIEQETAIQVLAVDQRDETSRACQTGKMKQRDVMSEYYADSEDACVVAKEVEKDLRSESVQVAAAIDYVDTNSKAKVEQMDASASKRLSYQDDSLLFNSQCANCNRRSLIGKIDSETQYWFHHSDTSAQFDHYKSDKSLQVTFIAEPLAVSEQGSQAAARKELADTEVKAIDYDYHSLQVVCRTYEGLVARFSQKVADLEAAAHRELLEQRVRARPHQKAKRIQRGTSAFNLIETASQTEEEQEFIQEVQAVQLQSIPQVETQSREIQTQSIMQDAFINVDTTEPVSIAKDTRDSHTESNVEMQEISTSFDVTQVHKVIQLGSPFSYLRDNYCNTDQAEEMKIQVPHVESAPAPVTADEGSQYNQPELQDGSIQVDLPEKPAQSKPASENVSVALQCHQPAMLDSETTYRTESANKVIQHGCPHFLTVDAQCNTEPMEPTIVEVAVPAIVSQLDENVGTPEIIWKSKAIQRGCPSFAVNSVASNTENFEVEDFIDYGAFQQYVMPESARAAEYTEGAVKAVMKPDSHRKAIQQGCPFAMLLEAGTLTEPDTEFVAPVLAPKVESAAATKKLDAATQCFQDVEEWGVQVELGSTASEVPLAKAKIELVDIGNQYDVVLAKKAIQRGCPWSMKYEAECDTTGLESPLVDSPLSPKKAEMVDCGNQYDVQMHRKAIQRGCPWFMTLEAETNTEVEEIFEEIQMNLQSTEPLIAKEKKGKSIQHGCPAAYRIDVAVMANEPSDESPNNARKQFGGRRLSDEFEDFGTQTIGDLCDGEVQCNIEPEQEPPAPVDSADAASDPIDIPRPAKRVQRGVPFSKIKNVGTNTEQFEASAQEEEAEVPPYCPKWDIMPVEYVTKSSGTGVETAEVACLITIKTSSVYTSCEIDICDESTDVMKDDEETIQVVSYRPVEATLPVFSTVSCQTISFMADSYGQYFSTGVPSRTIDFGNEACQTKEEMYESAGQFSVEVCDVLVKVDWAQETSQDSPNRKLESITSSMSVVEVPVLMNIAIQTSAEQSEKETEKSDNKTIQEYVDTVMFPVTHYTDPAAEVLDTLIVARVEIWSREVQTISFTEDSDTQFSPVASTPRKQSISRTVETSEINTQTETSSDEVQTQTITYCADATVGCDFDLEFDQYPKNAGRLRAAPETQLETGDQETQTVVFYDIAESQTEAYNISTAVQYVFDEVDYLAQQSRLESAENSVRHRAEQRTAQVQMSSVVLRDRRSRSRSRKRETEAVFTQTEFEEEETIELFDAPLQEALPPRVETNDQSESTHVELEDCSTTYNIELRESSFKTEVHQKASETMTGHCTDEAQVQYNPEGLCDSFVVAHLEETNLMQIVPHVKLAVSSTTETSIQTDGSLADMYVQFEAEAESLRTIVKTIDAFTMTVAHSFEELKTQTEQYTTASEVQFDPNEMNDRSTNTEEVVTQTADLSSKSQIQTREASSMTTTDKADSMAQYDAEAEAEKPETCAAAMKFATETSTSGAQTEVYSADAETECDREEEQVEEQFQTQVVVMQESTPRNNEHCQTEGVMKSCSTDYQMELESQSVKAGAEVENCTVSIKFSTEKCSVGAQTEVYSTDAETECDREEVQIEEQLLHQVAVTVESMPRRSEFCQTESTMESSATEYHKECDSQLVKAGVEVVREMSEQSTQCNSQLADEKTETESYTADFGTQVTLDITDHVVSRGSSQSQTDSIMKNSETEFESVVMLHATASARAEGSDEGTQCDARDQAEAETNTANSMQDYGSQAEVHFAQSSMQVDQQKYESASIQAKIESADVETQYEQDEEVILPTQIIIEEAEPRLNAECQTDKIAEVSEKVTQCDECVRIETGSNPAKFMQDFGSQMAVISVQIGTQIDQQKSETVGVHKDLTSIDAWMSCAVETDEALIKTEIQNKSSMRDSIVQFDIETTQSASITTKIESADVESQYEQDEEVVMPTQITIEESVPHIESGSQTINFMENAATEFERKMQDGYAQAKEQFVESFDKFSQCDAKEQRDSWSDPVRFMEDYGCQLQVSSESLKTPTAEASTQSQVETADSEILTHLDQKKVTEDVAIQVKFETASECVEVGTQSRSSMVDASSDLQVDTADKFTQSRQLITDSVSVAANFKEAKQCQEIGVQSRSFMIEEGSQLSIIYKQVETQIDFIVAETAYVNARTEMKTSGMQYIHELSESATQVHIKVSEAATQSSAKQLWESSVCVNTIQGKETTDRGAQSRMELLEFGSQHGLKSVDKDTVTDSKLFSDSNVQANFVPEAKQVTNQTTQSRQRMVDEESQLFVSTKDGCTQFEAAVRCNAAVKIAEFKITQTVGCQSVMEMSDKNAQCSTRLIDSESQMTVDSSTGSMKSIRIEQLLDSVSTKFASIDIGTETRLRGVEAATGYTMETVESAISAIKMPVNSSMQIVTVHQKDAGSQTADEEPDIEEEITQHTCQHETVEIQEQTLQKSEQPTGIEELVRFGPIVRNSSSQHEQEPSVRLVTSVTPNATVSSMQFSYSMAVASSQTSLRPTSDSAALFQPEELVPKALSFVSEVETTQQACQARQETTDGFARTRTEMVSIETSYKQELGDGFVRTFVDSVDAHVKQLRIKSESADISTETEVKVNSVQTSFNLIMQDAEMQIDKEYVNSDVHVREAVEEKALLVVSGLSVRGPTKSTETSHDLSLHEAATQALSETSYSSVCVSPALAETLDTGVETSPIMQSSETAFDVFSNSIGISCSTQSMSAETQVKFATREAETMTESEIKKEYFDSDVRYAESKSTCDVSTEHVRNEHSAETQCIFEMKNSAMQVVREFADGEVRAIEQKAQTMDVYSETAPRMSNVETFYSAIVASVECQSSIDHADVGVTAHEAKPEKMDSSCLTIAADVVEIATQTELAVSSEESVIAKVNTTSVATFYAISLKDSATLASRSYEDAVLKISEAAIERADVASETKITVRGVSVQVFVDSDTSSVWVAEEIAATEHATVQTAQRLTSSETEYKLVVKNAECQTSENVVEKVDSTVRAVVASASIQTMYNISVQDSSSQAIIKYEDANALIKEAVIEMVEVASETALRLESKETLCRLEICDAVVRAFTPARDMTIQAESEKIQTLEAFTETKNRLRDVETDFSVQVSFANVEALVTTQNDSVSIKEVILEKKDASTATEVRLKPVEVQACPDYTESAALVHEKAVEKTEAATETMRRMVSVESSYSVAVQSAETSCVAISLFDMATQVKQESFEADMQTDEEVIESVSSHVQMRVEMQSTDSHYETPLATRDSQTKSETQDANVHAVEFRPEFQESGIKITATVKSVETSYSLRTQDVFTQISTETEQSHVKYAEEVAEVEKSDASTSYSLQTNHREVQASRDHSDTGVQIKEAKTETAEIGIRAEVSTKSVETFYALSLRDVDSQVSTDRSDASVRIVEESIETAQSSFKTQSSLVSTLSLYNVRTEHNGSQASREFSDGAVQVQEAKAEMTESGIVVSPVYKIDIEVQTSVIHETSWLRVVEPVPDKLDASSQDLSQYESGSVCIQEVKPEMLDASYKFQAHCRSVETSFEIRQSDMSSQVSVDLSDGNIWIKEQLERVHSSVKAAEAVKATAEKSVEVRTQTDSAGVKYHVPTDECVTQVSTEYCDSDTTLVEVIEKVEVQKQEAKLQSRSVASFYEVRVESRGAQASKEYDDVTVLAREEKPELIHDNAKATVSTKTTDTHYNLSLNDGHAQVSTELAEAHVKIEEKIKLVEKLDAATLCNGPIMEDAALYVFSKQRDESSQATETKSECMESGIKARTAIMSDSQAQIATLTSESGISYAEKAVIIEKHDASTLYSIRNNDSEVQVSTQNCESSAHVQESKVETVQTGIRASVDTKFAETEYTLRLTDEQSQATTDVCHASVRNAEESIEMAESSFKSQTNLVSTLSLYNIRTEHSGAQASKEFADGAAQVQEVKAEATVSGLKFEASAKSVETEYSIRLADEQSQASTEMAAANVRKAEESVQTVESSFKTQRSMISTLSLYSIRTEHGQSQASKEFHDEAVLVHEAKIEAAESGIQVSTEIRESCASFKEKVSVIEKSNASTQYDIVIRKENCEVQASAERADGNVQIMEQKTVAIQSDVKAAVSTKSVDTTYSIRVLDEEIQASKEYSESAVRIQEETAITETADASTLYSLRTCYGEAQVSKDYAENGLQIKEAKIESIHSGIKTEVGARSVETAYSLRLSDQLSQVSIDMSHASVRVAEEHVQTLESGFKTQSNLRSTDSLYNVLTEHSACQISKEFVNFGIHAKEDRQSKLVAVESGMKAKVAAIANSQMQATVRLVGSNIHFQEKPVLKLHTGTETMPDVSVSKAAFKSDSQSKATQIVKGDFIQIEEFAMQQTTQRLEYALPKLNKSSQTDELLSLISGQPEGHQELREAGVTFVAPSKVVSCQMSVPVVENGIFRTTSNRTLSTQVEALDIPDAPVLSPTRRHGSHRHSMSRDTGSLIELKSKDQIFRYAPKFANALVSTSSRARDTGSAHSQLPPAGDQSQEKLLTGARTSDVFPPRHGFVVTGAKPNHSEEAQVRQLTGRRDASCGTDTRGLVDSAHKQIRVRPDCYEASVRTASASDDLWQQQQPQQQQQQHQEPRRTLESVLAITDADVIDRVRSSGSPQLRSALLRLLRPPTYDATVNAKPADAAQLELQQPQMLQQYQRPSPTFASYVQRHRIEEASCQTDRLTEADFEAWASQSLGRPVRIGRELPEESRSQPGQQQILEMDIDKVVDPESRLPLKPAVAIRLQVLTSDCGHYKLADGSFITSAEAVERGLIVLRSTRRH